MSHSALFVMLSCSFLENNSTTAIPTARAAPRCAAAATGTTEASAGRIGGRQSAAICSYSSNRASSCWVRDATSVSGSHSLPGRPWGCVPVGTPTPSLLHSKRRARCLPSACSMYHVLRRGPWASTAALQLAGTGTWRLLPAKEETDRWVLLTSGRNKPWCKTIIPAAWASYFKLQSSWVR